MFLALRFHEARTRPVQLPLVRKQIPETVLVDEWDAHRNATGVHFVLVFQVDVGGVVHFSILDFERIYCAVKDIHAAFRLQRPGRF